MSAGSRRSSREYWHGPIALVVLAVLTYLAVDLAANSQLLAQQPSTASMAIARGGHTATLLPDGRVLVVGGHSTITTAEIYDPAHNEWRPAGNISTVRIGHTATLLADGTVLVVGGYGALGPLNTAERYDPRDAVLGIQRYLPWVIHSIPPATPTTTILPTFTTPPTFTPATPTPEF